MRRELQCANTSTGPCAGFWGAHIAEAERGLPLLKGRRAVVFLGTNDVVDYDAVALPRMVASFLETARREGVEVAAWVGPSLAMEGSTAEATDAVFRQSVGNIPYISMLAGNYPRKGDGIHFTGIGYLMIKAAVDAAIATGRGSSLIPREN